MSNVSWNNEISLIDRSAEGLPAGITRTTVYQRSVPDAPGRAQRTLTKRPRRQCQTHAEHPRVPSHCQPGT